MTEAFKGIEATPTQRLVAYMLADAHNQKTGRCDLSIASLVQLTSLSERAVRYALNDLANAGHMTIENRPGTSSQYTLHPGTTCREPRHHVPNYPGKKCRGNMNKPWQELPPTPAPDAGNPGTTCREPRHHVPPNQKEPERTRKEPEYTEPKKSSIKKTVISSKTKKRANSKGRASLDEVKAFCKEVGLFPRDAEAMFWKWEGSGWLNSGKPIKDWMSVLRQWKAGGWLPSQKEKLPTDFWPEDIPPVSDEPDPELDDLLGRMKRNIARREAEEAAGFEEPTENETKEEHGDDTEIPF